MRLKIAVVCLFLSFPTLANVKEEAPPNIGNFALPSSSQPGPLIGFGEHVIDKNLKQLLLMIDDYAGIDKHFVDVVPGIVYGVTDTFSVTLNVPIAASYRQDDNRSNGFEDLLIQLEYAFYNKKTKSYQDQGTVVGNFSVPTGSVKKNPTTGFGSPSFFLGATFNRTYVDWFMFTAYGAILTTIHNHTKVGNQYLYQMGFGRNICYLKDKSIMAWMVEVTGDYATKDTINGIQNPNSGGNVVYVTPSLFLSWKKSYVQFGAGWPVTQNLFGDQKRENYLLAMYLTLTI